MHIRVRQSSRRVNGKPVKRYQAVWYERNREYRETFDTRELAQDKLDQVKAQLAHGQSPASLRELGRETFGVVAMQWLASRHDLKPRTRAEYVNLLSGKTRARRNSDGVSTAELSIAETFGRRRVNEIMRADIADWLGKLTEAGKSTSTVRHHYFVVRQILSQAVADGRLTVNPADHVKLPSERSAAGGTPGVVDDPNVFLTAAQVAALEAATPWPCNVMVHLAAWSGLRAAELAGLQVGDVELPERSINPNAPTKPGVLRVERTVIAIDGALIYDTPKTKGSRRRVPLMAATTERLRDYLAAHPRRDDPTAAMFCEVTLKPSKPMGKRATDADGKRIVPTAVDALAALSADQAVERLVVNWSAMLRHQTFYKAVFRPAVLRANRLGGADPVLPPALKFHALRHTYASLCVAAGIPPLQLSRFMGHAKVTTTLAIYTHLFDDDHAETMAALEAMSRPASPNVVPMRRAH
ncbi:tyrosine-type recombinase/integrase [Mycobacterium sp. E2733]|uniref:tyrosine-type recombinase/integrase n=1 Tax=Mycobacterium sp. E2733 TaxID=1834138 RepID=UPI0008003225|nr:tyrosine-type recombinase/integrase [Mycobacterium sp. E2733]OBH94299.1 integrase [Mycobacterium sp. E2733]